LSRHGTCPFALPDAFVAPSFSTPSSASRTPAGSAEFRRQEGRKELVEGQREEDFGRKQVSEVGHGEVLRKEEGRKGGKDGN